VDRHSTVQSRAWHKLRVIVKMDQRRLRGLNRDMINFLAIVAIVVVWVLLMKVILPRLGVPT
jgi:predicted nucleic acid-binding Zn ribbon protein